MVRTEGGSVDPKGDGLQVISVESSKRGEKKSKEAEMEVDGEMHQEDRVKIQSPN